MRTEIENIFRIVNNNIQHLRTNNNECSQHKNNKNLFITFINSYKLYSFFYILLIISCFIWWVITISKDTELIKNLINSKPLILIFFSTIDLIMLIYNFIHAPSGTIFKFLDILCGNLEKDELFSLTNKQKQYLMSLYITSIITGLSFDDIEKEFMNSKNFLQLAKNFVIFIVKNFTIIISAIILIKKGIILTKDQIHDLLINILNIMLSDHFEVPFFFTLILLSLFVFSFLTICHSMKPMFTYYKVKEAIRLYHSNKKNDNDFTDEKVHEVYCEIVSNSKDRYIKPKKQTEENSPNTAPNNNKTKHLIRKIDRYDRKKEKLKCKLENVTKSINSMRKELLSLKSDTNTLLNNNSTSEQK